MHPKKLIYKANPLITGSYSMSSRQQRLIAVLAAQVDPRDEGEFHTYTFDMHELSMVLGIEKDERRYENIRGDLRGLMSKVLSIQKDENIEILLHFVSVAKLNKETMKIEMQVHGELRPYYLDLKRHFTRYELTQVMGFRGTYTLRFYEWLKGEEYKKNKAGWWYVRIELTELRRRLDLDARKGQPRSKMPRWPDFRRWILVPSIDELNDKTSWSVSWEAVKWSRHVGEVKFHIGPKSQAKKTPATSDDVGAALKRCSKNTRALYEQKCEEEAERMNSGTVTLNRETVILSAQETILEEMAEDILNEAEANS